MPLGLAERQADLLDELTLGTGKSRAFSRSENPSPRGR